MLTAVPSASYVRPNNTTTYTAGDVVSDSATRLVFSNLRRVSGDTGEGCAIYSAVCVDEANQTLKPDLELWLFSADPTDLAADNAAFVATNTEMESLVGIIPFPVASFKVANAGAGAAGKVACAVSNVWLATNCNTLYGVLVVRNAYIPVANEKFVVTLQAVKED